MFFVVTEGRLLKVVVVFLPQFHGFNHLSTFMVDLFQVLVENYFLCMVNYKWKLRYKCKFTNYA